MLTCFLKENKIAPTPYEFFHKKRSTCEANRRG